MRWIRTAFLLAALISVFLPFEEVLAHSHPGPESDRHNTVYSYNISEVALDPDHMKLHVTMTVHMCPFCSPYNNYVKVTISGFGTQVTTNTPVGTTVTRSFVFDVSNLKVGDEITINSDVWCEWCGNWYDSQTYKVELKGCENQCSVNGLGGGCRLTLVRIASSVDIATGNLFDSYEISPDKKLPVTLSYNSRSARSSRFGHGWNDSLDLRVITLDDGSAILVNPDGREDVFTLNADSSYAAPPGIHDSLEIRHDTLFADSMENGIGSWQADAPWGQTQSASHSATTSWTDSPAGNYANSLHTALTLPLDLSSAGGAELTFFHRFAFESNYDFGYIEISKDGGANWTMLKSYTGYQNDWAAQSVSLKNYAGLNNLLLRFRVITDSSVTEDGWFIDDVEIKGASGHVLRRQDGSSVVFNGQGLPAELRDSNSNVTKYAYAGNMLASVTGPYGNTLTFANDGAHITSVTDSLGRPFNFAYDAEGNLTAITDSAGSSRTFAYDANHNLTERTDPSGGITRYAYDAQDRLTGATDSLGAARTVAHEGEGQTVLTDPSGGRTEYDYDGQFNLTKTVTPLGNVTAYEWDSDKNLTKETDPEGHATVREYDGHGNDTKTVDPNGNVTLKEYAAGSGCSVCGGGKPVKVTDALGNVTEYAYDDAGNQLSVKDALGHTAASTYDGKGRLLSETGTDGAVTAYEYDAAGNVVKVTDALGNAVSRQYDAAGYLISETDALGNISSFTYDIMGRQLTSTDPLGRTETSTYDAEGNLVKTVDAEGNATVYSYDLKGNRTGVTDPAGATISFAYNADGQIIRTAHPDGTVEEIGYDADGRKISEKDRNGGVTSYAYTPAGHLEKVTRPDGSSAEYTYDANGNRLTEKDGLGNTASYEYDRLNRVVKTVDAAGRETVYAYDALGRKTAETTSEGTVSYEYDAAGNIVRTTQPDGSSVSSEYDMLDRQTAVIDALGNRTVYEYDALGRLVKTTDPAGAVTRSEYDAAGNLVKSIDALGRETLYEYDRLNRLVKVTDPEGGVTEYAYDAAGNRISAADPAGKVTRFEYDMNNRLVKTVHPDGSSVQNFYDANGNLIKIIDQNGNVRTFTYDGQNRKISETDALGSTTEFTYDAAGNQTRFVTPDEAVTGMTYSPAGQLLTKTLPDGSVRSTAYTQAGRIASVTNARGQSVSYAYDSSGRLTGKTWATGSSAFTYDSAGRLLSLTHTEGAESNTVSFAYDPLGRVLTETQNGLTVSYAYDPVGNIVKTVYPSGKTVEYTYTAADRISTVSVDGAPLAAYSYDARGLVTEAAHSSGIVMTRTYDDVGRVLSVLYKKGGQTVIGYEHTYDQAGNRLSKRNPVRPDRSDRYAYDAAYQLLQYAKGAADRPLHSRAWTYDVMGNWLSSPQDFDYFDDFSRPDTDGQTDDIGGLFTENGSLKSRIRTGQAELRRSNNGQAELPALLTANGVQGVPYSLNALFSFDKGAKKEEPVSAGFLFGYQNPANWWWAGARLEQNRQFWTLGQAVDGSLRTVLEVPGAVSAGKPMALELEFDGEEAKLYQNDSLMLSGNVGQAAATGLSGLVGAQNKTLADNFWMISGLNDEREHNAVNELVSRNGRALEYDGDGNLTKDDEGRIYAWDIFSRLISVTTAEARVEFSYDALGRRMSKSVDLGNDGSVERETAYIYSGWNCVEERAAANGAQAETAYVWAEDLSGSMQGAGGVGGLLAVIDGAGAHTAASDANGNVAAYFDGSGNIAAEYDYTPFGTVLSKSGAKADGFAYRFSTKPYDAETGLYYYGFRHYSPELGRWISQDPIEEAGGLNLYGFVFNNPINLVDKDGRAAVAVLAAPPALYASAAILTTTAFFLTTPTGRQLLGNAATGIANTLQSAADACKEAADAMVQSAADAMVKYEQMCNQLNNAVQSAKSAIGRFGKNKAGCQCSMSCGELRARKTAWLTEAVARAQRDSLCWGGGDMGHQIAQATAWGHVGKCTVLMKLNNCP